MASHTPRPIALVLAATILLALVVAGCSSGGNHMVAVTTSTTVAGAATTATTVPAAAEPTTSVSIPSALMPFDAAGNAICKRSNAEVDALPQPKPTGATVTRAEMNAIADIFEKSATLDGREVDELARLPHPPSFSAQITAALALVRSTLRTAAASIAELRAGQYTKAISTIESLDTGAVNKAFDALGLTTCGSGGI